MVSGGPDGELGASLRYLSQRYSMPYPELKAILTDIGISVSVMATYPADMTSSVFTENAGFKDRNRLKRIADQACVAVGLLHSLVNREFEEKMIR